MYRCFGKRLLDIVVSLAGLAVLSPVLLLLILLGAVIMKGNPFFTQIRPGKDEKLFHLIKFRSMTLEKDEKGRLLPDEKRLTGYGRLLRSTSLDELPELINILKGDMSLVGPRPMLVRDMVFMTAEQRRRHTVRAGLTGLAQASGRNGIAWEDKLARDLEYIERITLLSDLRILWKTALQVIKREGITEEGMATAADLGDYLLAQGKIDEETYQAGQMEAERLLKKEETWKNTAC